MILKIENLNFGYNKNNIILNNINFECKDADVIAILGKNGVGKTTLLNNILKIQKPLSGNIIIDDKDYNTLSKIELYKYLSFVPQHSNIYLNFKVFDSILIGLSKYINAFNTPTKEDSKKVYEIMDRLNISNLKNKFLYEISGGELQLCLIARALISNPRIIIMDEPETGLDINNQIYVLKLIKKLAKDDKKIIIFNTHYIEHALNFSNKCLMLNRKGYIFGETNEVINSNNIKNIFDVNVDINILNNNKKYILINYD